MQIRSDGRDGMTAPRSVPALVYQQMRREFRRSTVEWNVGTEFRLVSMRACQRSPITVVWHDVKLNNRVWKSTQRRLYARQ